MENLLEGLEAVVVEAVAVVEEAACRRLRAAAGAAI